jgi:sulfatase maturation enzyme AslB (radical SAM superfamily)
VLDLHYRGGNILQSKSIFQKPLIAGLNPSLQFIISKFDINCEQDGSLLVNSLKLFLGEDVDYCQRCTTIDDKVANRLYEIACSFMRLNPQFMKSMFLNKKYGEAWLRGFVLMMKGIKKFGIRSPFTPTGSFEVVWNFTYNCNLRCKHCYENAGIFRPELSTEQAFEAIDYLSQISGIGLPALSFSGGEPLARADFFEMANYAKKKIPYVSIATNGTLLPGVM